jgi:hypothetical protein
MNQEPAGSGFWSSLIAETAYLGLSVIAEFAI